MFGLFRSRNRDPEPLLPFDGRFKPSWADAPLWANWLAMDKGGDWYWYKTKPLPRANAWHCDVWYYKFAGNVDTKRISNCNWLDTLERGERGL